jgi:hypothetical protein
VCEAVSAFSVAIAATTVSRKVGASTVISSFGV